MKVRVLRQFPLYQNGVTRMTDAGVERDIDDDLVPGLLAARLVESIEAAAEEPIEEAGVGDGDNPFLDPPANAEAGDGEGEGEGEGEKGEDDKPKKPAPAPRKPRQNKDLARKRTV